MAQIVRLGSMGHFVPKRVSSGKRPGSISEFGRWLPQLADNGPEPEIVIIIHDFSIHPHRISPSTGCIMQEKEDLSAVFHTCVSDQD